MSYVMPICVSSLPSPELSSDLLTLVIMAISIFLFQYLSLVIFLVQEYWHITVLFTATTALSSILVYLMMLQITMVTL